MSNPDIGSASPKPMTETQPTLVSAPIKECIIKFLAPINQQSITTLINIVDDRLKKGINKFTLLLSSNGGSVFYGFSAYNYLKGIPAEIVTHNFGSIDSIAVVLYCAGKHRYSVPNASFLIHGVASNFQNERLEEKQLEERLNGLIADAKNIARAIAENTGKTAKVIHKMMKDRKTIHPDEAKKIGLVHEIKTNLFESCEDIVNIIL